MGRGAFLDTVGNASEELWDYWWEVDWPYLVDGPSDRVDRINQWFLAYYLLDRNFVCGIAVVSLYAGISLISWPRPVWFMLAVAAVVLTVDACILRRELRKLLKDPNP